ncbi:hypothetical protein [Mycolicibacterium grossiae]|uniref:Uncharacterized protein n=1 Tax=Mycolicibacterium grossiae TaxID=1552759 RepID=A0A1E8PY21_9MYCO|nr:hypothetical protein [Mycolicibacterium grossiae]OFJ50574.1 hypothetical protein BEL07_27480 [Mycolicibacterium grossiae]QEM43527.1 hypothetical protein FZ046_00920 [Mycolicibacterium grossiae]
MSGGGGGGLIDRLVGAAVGVLVAAFALYCAVRLIEAVLPTLLVIVGVLGLIGLVIGSVVVLRTWKERW